MPEHDLKERLASAPTKDHDIPTELNQDLQRWRPPAGLVAHDRCKGVELAGVAIGPQLPGLGRHDRHDVKEFLRSEFRSAGNTGRYAPSHD